MPFSWSCVSFKGLLVWLCCWTKRASRYTCFVSLQCTTWQFWSEHAREWSNTQIFAAADFALSTIRWILGLFGSPNRFLWWGEDSSNLLKLPIPSSLIAELSFINGLADNSLALLGCLGGGGCMVLYEITIFLNELLEWWNKEQQTTKISKYLPWKTYSTKFDLASGWLLWTASPLSKDESVWFKFTDTTTGREVNESSGQWKEKKMANNWGRGPRLFTFL